MWLSCDCYHDRKDTVKYAKITRLTTPSTQNYITCETYEYVAKNHHPQIHFGGIPWHFSKYHDQILCELHLARKFIQWNLNESSCKNLGLVKLITTDRLNTEGRDPTSLLENSYNQKVANYASVRQLFPTYGIPFKWLQTVMSNFTSDESNNFIKNGILYPLRAPYQFGNKWPSW